MLIVCESGLLRRDVGECVEGVAVEGELGFVATQIVDRDLVVDGAEVLLRLAGRGGFDVVIWGGAVGWGRVEREGGGDGPAGWRAGDGEGGLEFSLYLGGGCHCGGCGWGRSQRC